MAYLLGDAMAMTWVGAMVALLACLKADVMDALMADLMAYEMVAPMAQLLVDSWAGSMVAS